MRIHIDTNVALRFVTGEPPHLALKAREFFEMAHDRGVELYVCDAIFVEMGFVLWKVQRMERTAVAALLGSLLRSPVVVAERKEILQRCLELFERHRVDLADAYLAARALADAGGASGVGNDATAGPTVVSFDRDLDRIPGLRRITSPDQLVP